MTHFTVVACLSDEDGSLAKANRDGGGMVMRLIEDRLAAALAPFDENREVTPYRDYEEGEPAGFWWVQSVRRGAESHRQLAEKGAGTLAIERVGKVAGHEPRSMEIAVQAVEGHAAGWAEDSGWSAKLGDNPTWADVARLYNEKYGTEEKDPLLVDDEGRAYRMSSYNPDSKWDWYAVGGRWLGYFTYREECISEVIAGQPGVGDNKAKPLHCDAGPLHALDLAALRDERAADAVKAHAGFAAIAAGHPQGRSWAEFCADVEAGRMEIDQARRDYHAQPVIKALDRTDYMWASDPIATFGVSEEAYAEQARASAVPGYAVLTADGKWMAPGRMGWFGVSSDDADDRAAYHEAANAYIGSLPASAWLVAVDCHI